jgi:hypothetical protein
MQNSVMYLDRHHYKLFKNRRILKFESKIWILIGVRMFSSFLFLVINTQRTITTFYLHSLSKCSVTKTFIAIFST